MKEKSTKNAMVRQGIEEVMPLGEELEIAEIKKRLFKEKGISYGKDYSEGNLASALRLLSSNGVLKKTRRGIYQKTGDERSGYDEEMRENSEETEEYGKCDVKDILEIFEKNRSRIKMISREIRVALKNVDLSNEMSDKEFDELKNVMNFNNALSELLKEFER